MRGHSFSLQKEESRLMEQFDLNFAAAFLEERAVQKIAGWIAERSEKSNLTLPAATAVMADQDAGPSLLRGAPAGVPTGLFFIQTLKLTGYRLQASRWLFVILCHAVMSRKQSLSENIDDLHPLAQQAVSDYDSLQTLDSWLQVEYTDMHDPFLFADMKKAVERVVQAIQNEERIVIFADFDTDGIPAAAMWRDLFARLNFDNCSIYIPERDVEGFGLKTKQIQEFAADGADLIVTVDCGIRSHEAVAAARDDGIDVIICDHHLPADTTPEANAIINPALPDTAYPFSGLCGAGVVLKLFQALAVDERIDISDNFVKGQMGLAAIATISDMVPLVDENHIIATLGLALLRSTNRPGLQALYEAGRIHGSELTAVDVGFTIGSHINAASRLDQPKLAFQLLTVRNRRRGKQLADKLHAVYRRRKRRTAQLKQAVNQALDGHTQQSVIACGSEDWKPALLGPVAHRVTDAYDRPVFLWGQANGRTKGSARATRHNVVGMLQAVSKDHLHTYGGHELAGGFELTTSPPDSFRDDLQTVVDRFQVSDTQSVEPIPADLNDLDWSLYNSLEQLGPFGVQHPQPLFRVTGLRVVDVHQFGSDNEHITLTVSAGEEGPDREAVSFFASDTMKRTAVGDRVAIIGALEKTTFGFEKKLRFRMESITHLDTEI